MSKILVARNGDLGFVKVVGRGSFQNSGCFKSFYLQLLKDGVKRFVVDLGLCSYLDSTFLGTLLGLGLKLRDGGAGLTVLNAGARNQELLRNLGLDRLIDIAGGSQPGSGDPGKTATLSQSLAGVLQGGSSHAANGVKEEHLKDLACVSPSRAEAAPTILEAHEALMNFDPRNVPKFKDVVEFLREDLGQSAATP